MHRSWTLLAWLTATLMAGAVFAQDAGSAAGKDSSHPATGAKQEKGAFTLLFTGDNGGEVAPCG